MNQPEKRIRLPYNFAPRPYQIPLLKALDDGCKRAVACWHRRSGKDKTALNYMIKEAFRRVGPYFYFAPSYRQGKKVIWDGIDGEGFPFLKHFPEQLLDGKPNDTEMKCKLVNGSYFQIVGTDNFDSIVGTNPVGCVFTEYSLQNPKAWDYIRPILAQNNGWALFLFTPRGMNHAWKLIQQAQNDAFIAATNPRGWFVQTLTVDDTKGISQEILEQEKKEMPLDLFEQEYYCKFIEGAGAFFTRITENVWLGELPIVPQHRYQIGVDLAKYHDWTVITAVDLFTFEVGIQERFHNVDWAFQKARIEAVSAKYRGAKVWIDATGLGDPIEEDLRHQGVPVEGFKFTEQSKRQLLDNLRLLLSQDQIKIPNDDGLIGELRSMAFHLSEAGKLKLQVPEGLFDDRIMSLALACWQLPSRPQKFYTLEDGSSVETVSFNTFSSDNF